MPGGVLGMKNGFYLFLVLGVLLLGCAQPASQAPSTSATASVPDLPLEEAKKAMIEQMQKSGGDASVPSEPRVEDSGFSGKTERSGAFQPLGYMTDGSATLQTKDGKAFVVFGDDFSTPNGPDVVVYLTKNQGPSSREAVTQGVLLGELKSLKGKQVYEVPAGTDVSAYNAVTLHCRAFNVPWSYASLK